MERVFEIMKGKYKLCALDRQVVSIPPITYPSKRFEMKYYCFYQINEPNTNVVFVGTWSVNNDVPAVKVTTDIPFACHECHSSTDMLLKPFSAKIPTLVGDGECQAERDEKLLAGCRFVIKFIACFKCSLCKNVMSL